MPDNVQLRPVADGDLPIFFEHQRDPQGVHMAAFTVPDPDDRAAFDDHWRWLRNNPTILMRTIAVNGQPAGHVSSYVGDVGLEVTYWLGREYWGRGIATAALQAFLLIETHRPLRGRAPPLRPRRSSVPPLTPDLIGRPLTAPMKMLLLMDQWSLPLPLL